MNLKVLFALLVYWGLWGIIFSLGATALFPTGATFSNHTYLQNQTGASGDEITTGGIFGSGLNFGRFLSLTFFGIGMPSSTPAWAMIIFGIFQSCITLLGVGFFISSIWNG